MLDFERRNTTRRVQNWFDYCIYVTIHCNYCHCHYSTGVTSGVSMVKIELECESNLGTMDYRVQNRVQKQPRKSKKYGVLQMYEGVRKNG